MGVKFRYALEWGVHCVSTQWFFDSINKKACQDEAKYHVPISEATKKALFHPANVTPLDLSRLSLPMRRRHLMQLVRGAPEEPMSPSPSMDLTLRRIPRPPTTRPRVPEPPHFVWPLYSSLLISGLQCISFFRILRPQALSPSRSVRCVLMRTR